mmetsp:Transcript_17528/g.43079  ORF Transcript_17528/g.43079 Transcript_17528/m.43079 type:complete len:99 (+) Transcript_17528:120-416(+)
MDHCDAKLMKTFRSEEQRDFNRIRNTSATNLNDDSKCNRNQHQCTTPETSTVLHIFKKSAAYELWMMKSSSPVLSNARPFSFAKCKTQMKKNGSVASD